jgi:hypothetical protein
MNPTSLHNSTSLAQFILRDEGHSCTSKTLLSFFISVLFSYSTLAQDSIIKFTPSDFKQNHGDSIRFIQTSHKKIKPINGITDKQVTRRVKIIAATNIAGYGAALVALNSTWYKNYPRSSFHTFNDIPEWKGMDKIGHIYGVYAESLASMELWRWAGVSRKQRIWYGGLSGPVYHTVIEVLDGFSTQWGWSWGDIGANFIGSGMVIAQELAWDEQRIQFKFSFHRKNYNDSALNLRSNKIFGSSTAERFLKDYNGQTYWLSANIHSFFPQIKWPKWLNLAVGTGAEGMFGANDNIGKDDAGNIVFNRPDIKRYRQWYLSPDIDLTKIKTNKKGLKLAFRLLNIVKIPMPALEFSNGSFKVRAIAF